MKITFISHGKRRFTLRFPAGLALNPVALRLAGRNGQLPSLSPAQLRRLRKELRQAATILDGQPLVEALDADGEGVCIRL